MTEARRRLPIWPGHAAAGGELSPSVRTKRQLRSLSGHVLSGARQVADEGEFLFVGAIAGVNGGIEKAAEGIVSAGQRMSPKRLAARLGLRSEQTIRDRIRKLLTEEARRAPIEVPPEGFDEFSEKMGLLFELIFAGVIRIEDIVLEGDEIDEGSTLDEVDDRQLSFAGLE